MKTINKLLLPGILFTVSGCQKQDPPTRQNEPPDNPSPSAQPQYIGVTFGYNKLTRSGGVRRASGNTIYNVPLFKRTTSEDDRRDDMAEELVYSGVDYIAPVDRGHLPDFPRTDHGDGYDSSSLFDCGDTANYRYIWDYNIRVTFCHVLDQMRFKIDDRPVIFFWGITSYAFKHYGDGHLKTILLYIRHHCQSAFGFNPYIVVDQSWLTSEPETNDTAVVNAADSWFTVANHWTLNAYDGVQIGCAVPGFYVVDDTTNMQIDASHGKTFIDGLKNTYHAGALLTLVEGFRDCAENAAVWRSTGTTYYDYPNQRLNIIRRYSHNPYPDTLKIEGEGCDFFHDLTPGNSGGLYRDGDPDIAKTPDMDGGWEVTGPEANKWMEWEELPLNAHATIKISYLGKADASVKLSVGGSALSTINLPVTGQGEWSTELAGNTTLTDKALLIVG